jgi:hypothetical protein
MSLYEKLEKATGDKDAGSYLDLLHDDYVFVRHQSGQTMNKRAMGDMLRKMMAIDSMSVHDNRCIYENDDILVEHSVMDFPDGTREAVMGVHVLKDGKILRTETGATLVRK